MHARRTAVAIVVAGGLLLGGLVAAPSASAEDGPFLTYGRVAPTLSSPPSSTKPVARWVASAQGEDARNAKGENTALRARAAVQETAGVTRAVIYDVTLERLIDGRWQPTEVRRTQDVLSTQPANKRAYAIAYAPQAGKCGFDDDVKRAYRVVQHHAVRRVDGALAKRTVISKTFTARALWSDPLCPAGAWNLSPGGYEDGDLLKTHEAVKVETEFSYLAKDEGTAARGVTLTVWFSDSTNVTDVPAGWERDFPSEGRVNLFTRTVATWSDGRTENPVWTFAPTNADDDWFIRLFAQAQEPRPNPPDNYFVTGDVVDAATTADLTLSMYLPDHVEGWNVDRNPERDRLQLRTGDTVTVGYDIANAGPADATNVVLVGDWPDELGGVSLAEVAGEPVDCTLTPPDEPFESTEIRCPVGEVPADGVVTLYAQAPVTGTVPPGPDDWTSVFTGGEVSGAQPDAGPGLNADFTWFELWRVT
jgi:hypothetical protein